MLLPMLLLVASVLPSSDQPQSDDVQAEAAAALAKLPGHTAFLVTELTSEGPRPLYGLRQDERFAIGSSFKLYILGLLAAEVNDDRRGLDNVMRLEAQWVGPQHSEMAYWPLQSPVTLQTLALKMISISDNTATDHLLHLLGRQRVEEQMSVMGNHHPEWNIPLLSTREMAMLRDKHTGMLGRAYQKLDVAERRTFLADHFQGTIDYDKLDFDAGAYDAAEWYGTPLDMAAALDWIKNHTEEGQPANALRGVMAVETKLPHDAKQWPYVGFKGGSEAQLLAGNWLLKNANGKWYTMHVFYNNPDGEADQEQTIKAIGAIFAAVSRAL